MNFKPDNVALMLSPIGLTLGITQIESVLGIILLIFQVALILWKTVSAIIRAIKTKDESIIDEGLKETIDSLQDYINKLQAEKEKEDDTQHDTKQK